MTLKELNGINGILCMQLCMATKGHKRSPKVKLLMAQNKLHKVDKECAKSAPFTHFNVQHMCNV